jgi:hypothetical protein
VATFKEIGATDIKTSRSVLNQLVDVIQEDISGSATRRSYQIFVTGGIGPGVTSSLYQTVYDQDFSLQTANQLFDVTFGTYYSGSLVYSSSTGQDSNGKLLFPSQSLMMREKVDIYKQYAANLLGDANAAFYTPFGSPTITDRADNALFLSFKRLFTRDKMKRETFAVKMYYSASWQGGSWRASGSYPNDGGFNTQTDGGGTIRTRQMPIGGGTNLNATSILDSRIYTDFGASQNRRRTFGGEVGDLVYSSNTAVKAGLIFYDAGTVMLNLDRVMNGTQPVSGVIDAMRAGTLNDVATGKTVLGGCANSNGRNYQFSQNPLASFIPDLLTSGSIDDIIRHVCTTRFSSGSLTAATFQNNTNINSTLIFCRATADEFNYSSNPTFTNSSNRIVVVDEGQEDTQRTFSFITTVGLYDVNDNLLAVAKLSRPIEKNDEKDLTVRVRLDF